MKNKDCIILDAILRLGRGRDPPKDGERNHGEATTDTEEQSCRAATLEENSSWGST